MTKRTALAYTPVGWKHVEGTYDTGRLKVPGGWLYRDRMSDSRETTMCFVPEANDEAWEP